MVAQAARQGSGRATPVVRRRSQRAAPRLVERSAAATSSAGALVVAPVAPDARAALIGRTAERATAAYEPAAGDATGAAASSALRRGRNREEPARGGSAVRGAATRAADAGRPLLRAGRRAGADALRRDGRGSVPADAGDRHSAPPSATGLPSSRSSCRRSIVCCPTWPAARAAPAAPAALSVHEHPRFFARCGQSRRSPSSWTTSNGPTSPRCS